MKNSGIEWIGEIPDDWNLIRFKDICVNCKEIAGARSSLFDRLALTLNGVIRRDKDDSDGLQPKEFDGYQIIYENDFIFKMIDLQNISTSRVGLSPYTGLVSPAYIRFSPRKKEQYTLFVYYFLMSLYYNCVYNNLGGNGVRSALNATDMGQLLIPFPSIDTQIHIVSMIENRCAAVDRLIENQRAQIEKLKEYKQSVITEAVTRGLDPSAPLKDSGIEWLGKIPMSWKTTRIKYACIFNPIYSHFNQCDSVGYVPMECVKNGYMENREISINEISSGLTCFADGDIIMAKVTPCFENGNIAIASNLKNGIGYGSSELFVFRSTNICTKFLFYFLRNNLFIEYAKATMTGTGGLKRVSPTFIKSLKFAYPCEEEQQQIADYLDKKCAEIDKLISIKQQKIETLTEYKKSLIYEYVTGKKQVG